MIEIATAMSLATTAFRGVKKMVEAGKEAEDMYGYFMKFFEATESVSEADVMNQNAPKMSKLFAGKSVEAQALEIAMARSRMEKMEKELKDLMLWTGNDALYFDMMRERRNIRNARLAAARRKAQNKQLLIDGSMIVGVMLAAMFGMFIVVGAIGAGGS